MARAAEARTEGKRDPEQAGQPGVLRRLWDQFGTLAVAIAIALAIRAFVIEPYRIPSGSMLPTLLIGDHLFVNKFIYGAKLPFTDWRLPAIRDPQRGDVVVFTVARDERGGIYPADQRPELGQDRFVKRIVGLPGDTLEVRGGALYLNGEPVEVRYDDERFRDEVGRELRVGTEELPGRTHAVLDEPGRAGPERRPITIEAGRYFVMGDNRDFSNDSRIWGTVRLAELKGPAFVLYWSWDWDGPWLQLLNPLTWVELLTDRMRWDRIGHTIQ